MRIVLQRVSRAEVRVEGRAVASIKRGFVLLVGFTHDDSETVFSTMANKIASLRIFEDANGKMNLSLRDIDGEVIAVPQFTLYGDTNKGRRPSFVKAATPPHAKRLFDQFLDALRETEIKVSSGVFGAHMEVDLINDGPVTFMFDLAQSRVKG
jgi:D-tyrosyl-tRNA(Tyr) deacylase